MRLARLPYSSRYPTAHQCFQSRLWSAYSLLRATRQARATPNPHHCRIPARLFSLVATLWINRVWFAVKYFWQTPQHGLFV